jgi:hypothetical protein
MPAHTHSHTHTLQGAYLVPLTTPYKPPMPDQSKCVQIAFLGHGVVSMLNVPRLPGVHHLARRIKELQDEVCVCTYTSSEVEWSDACMLMCV